MWVYNKSVPRKELKVIEIELAVEKYGTRKRWMAISRSTPKGTPGYVMYWSTRRYRLEEWVKEHESFGRIKVLNRL